MGKPLNVHYDMSKVGKTAVFTQRLHLQSVANCPKDRKCLHSLPSALLQYPQYTLHSSGAVRETGM